MFLKNNLVLLASEVLEKLPAGLDRDYKPDMIDIEVRRHYVSSTLRELADWIPADMKMSLAEMGTCYEVLGISLSRNDATKRSRGILCQQLHQLCRSMDGDPIPATVKLAIARGVVVWEIWMNKTKASKDPRHLAMYETFARENGVLQTLLMNL